MVWSQVTGVIQLRRDEPNRRINEQGELQNCVIFIFSQLVLIAALFSFSWEKKMPTTQGLEHSKIKHF